MKAVLTILLVMVVVTAGVIVAAKLLTPSGVEPTPAMLCNNGNSDFEHELECWQSEGEPSRPLNAYLAERGELDAGA